MSEAVDQSPFINLSIYLSTYLPTYPPAIRRRTHPHVEVSTGPSQYGAAGLHKLCPQDGRVPQPLGGPCLLSGSVLELFGRSWGPPWGLLGGPWAAPGASWVPLGGSWGPAGGASRSPRGLLADPGGAFGAKYGRVGTPGALWIYVSMNP